MPDLNFATSQKWLSSCRPPETALGEPDRCPIEDTPAVDAALAELLRKLEAAGQSGGAPLSASFETEPMRDEFRRALAQLGSMKIAALVSAVLTLPDADAIVGGLLETETTGSSAFLKGFMSASDRFTTLGKIYDADRLKVLHEICGALAAEQEAA